MKPDVDLDALLAALTLAPRTFARNRFFWLFERPEAAKIRRRAARVRGILRQLAGTPKPSAEIVGERVLSDGQVHLRYRVEELGYTRTAALSALDRRPSGARRLFALLTIAAQSLRCARRLRR